MRGFFESITQLSSSIVHDLQDSPPSSTLFFSFNQQNLTKFDPFDVNVDEDKGVAGNDALVHIRIQQRNGRKTLTTVQVHNFKFLW